jgi:phosphatidylserine decarboxylase
LTFNDFFARKLKPGVRPIAAPHDDSILVSPADCRLLVFPSIDDTTKIWLKGQDFTIASLLGPNFQHLLHHFHNPAVAIARLAPQDYHRWHMCLLSSSLLPLYGGGDVRIDSIVAGDLVHVVRLSL